MLPLSRVVSAALQPNIQPGGASIHQDERQTTRVGVGNSIKRLLQAVKNRTSSPRQDGNRGDWPPVYHTPLAHTREISPIKWPIARSKFEPSHYSLSVYPFALLIGFNLTSWQGFSSKASNPISPNNRCTVARPAGSTCI